MSLLANGRNASMLNQDVEHGKYYTLADAASDM